MNTLVRLDTPESQLQDDEIDLRHYWNVVNKHKWGILSFSLLMALIALLVAYTLTPIYRATATLLIESKEAKVVSIEEVYGLGGNSREYLQTQYQVLKSRALVERVVTELDLVNHPAFDPRQQQVSAWKFWARLSWRDLLPIELPTNSAPPSEEAIFAAVVGKFSSQLFISPVRNTQVVKISFESADRQLAPRAANAIAKAYIESHLEAKLDMTREATSWLNQRLVSLKSKLEASEKALQEFREQENLVDIQGVSTLGSSEVSSLNAQLVDARRQRSEAETLYRQVKGAESASLEYLMSLPSVMNHSLVSGFVGRVAEASQRVEELKKRYRAKHPKMIAAQSELESANSNLRKQVKSVVDGIERDYEVARAQEASLLEELEKSKQEFQEVSRKEFRFRELEREARTNRQLYETFFSRIRETSETSDLKTVNARILDQALIPGGPIKPQKKKIVLLVLLLSLMASVGMVFVREILNNTIRSVADVEAKLQAPLLGVLPQLKANKKGERLTRLFLDKEQKNYAESIRTIRTGVVLSGIEKPHKVIMVTSSVPGEGKTTLSTNMALAMGQMEEKVLLIDADMRRPSVAKDFGYPAGTPGLANLIAGTAKFGEVVHKGVDGIDVITAGMVPPNPLELLSSTQFRKLIEALKTKYDRIVIDTAPVQAVSDALVLSEYSDSLIYVVRADSTSADLAKSGIGRLLQARAPLNGVVLNQLNVKKASKYYGYTYGYYDHYGYSSSSAS